MSNDDMSQDDDKTRQSDISTMIGRLKSGPTIIPAPEVPKTLEQRGQSENETLLSQAQSDKNRQTLLLEDIRAKMAELDPLRLELVRRQAELQAEMNNLNAKETELALQESECIERIEHYSHQMLQAEMINLRRTQRS